MIFLKNYNKEILIFLLSALYLISIIFFPESFGMGGSEIPYWSYFKDYKSFFSDLDTTGLQEIRWNYAEFRWGFYIFPLLMDIFFSEINVLFLTTPIIMFVTYLMLVVVLKNHLSVYSLLFFSFTWFLHPEINDFIYSFTTNGVSLFALSIILYFTNKYNLFDLDLKKKLFLIFIFFWFYGIKETNLVFFLFPVFFILKNINLKNFFILITFSLCLYFIESIIIYFLSEKTISYGRLFYHLFSSAPEAWNNFILTNDTKLGIEYSAKKEFSRNLADGAVFSRWHFTGLTPNFYYYLGLLLSIKNIFSKNTPKFIYYVSLLYLSYFFLLSFLLVQIFPPRPFIHLNFGIQIIGFPLSLILFCNFFDKILINFKQSKKFVLIKITLTIFLFILINLKFLNYYYKVGLNDIKSVSYNLLNISDYIVEFTNKINNQKCLSIKGSPVHIYHVIDNRLKDYHKANIKEFINKDKYLYVTKVTSNKEYTIPDQYPCFNKKIIYKFNFIE
jgi:hypothetical protein